MAVKKPAAKKTATRKPAAKKVVAPKVVETVEPVEVVETPETVETTETVVEATAPSFDKWWEEVGATELRRGVSTKRIVVKALAAGNGAALADFVSDEKNVAMLSGKADAVAAAKAAFNFK